MDRLFHFLKLRFTQRLPFLSLKQRKGLQAEKQAARYLQQQGLRLVTMRYVAKSGEIDLILWEHDCLVFVEVRYRTHEYAYDDALESIHAIKQARLQRTAEHYLRTQRLQQAVPCRFDVVIIAGKNIHWLKNAL